MSDKPRLQMTDIHKRFGPTVALDGVSISVDSGQVLALVGENGAGKSTLVKILSGAYRADRGAMWLDGQPYQPRHPLEGRRAGVAMIYQELSLAPDLSVLENIVLGAEPHWGPWVRWRLARERAAEALRRVGRPDLHLNRLVGKLSPAEQQLVEIARALAGHCRVLVLDEPTSSLTAADIERLFQLVGQLRDQGEAIIYISHFLEEIQAISDHYAVLRDGRGVGEGRTAEATIEGIIGLMVGRAVEDLYPRSERVAGDVVLEVQGLSGKVRPRRAGFALRRGEVLGIAGLVGAGRTELLRCLLGLDAVQQGQIRLALLSGQPLQKAAHDSPRARWRAGLGMVSEDRTQEGLALNLSLSDNLTLSRLPFFTSPAAQRRASGAWIQRLAIRCAGPDQPVRDLSGGNQQKVALARLLHHDVDVLLLDEPTRGIDVASKAQIYQLIDELALRGCAVLMVSSYLPELLGVCDRIAVMCRGVLGAARPAAELSEHAIMREAIGATELAERKGA